MNYKEGKRILEANGQGHVLRFWDRLDKSAREALLAQIASINFDEVSRMQSMLHAKPRDARHQFKPAPVLKWTRHSRAEALKKGEDLLRRGRVAALLVAGGQGSRLGFDGPKGAYPIGPVTDMPLFYFHARKLVRLARRYGRPVPLYIMTSEVNHAATRACFEDHCYFGLNPADVIFFQQGTWPALDEEGQLILEAPGRIFVSPDGHGGTLAALHKSGALDDMRTRRVATLFYFQVDNPLVEVADPAFVGLHALRNSEYSLKLCLKSAPDEKMGVVALAADGHCNLIEYSELTDKQAARFKYGSPAIHVFSRAFLERMACQPMPLHVAHKRIPYIDESGGHIEPKAPNGYKFEKFIFDILPEAGRFVNLAFERGEEFSPVKNSAGVDSPESCQRELQAKWRRWLRDAGVAVPEDLSVEIDPAYAGSAADLKSGLSFKSVL